MKLRNRRAMSVLLAASMVFSMNTAAFAEEIPAEAVEEVAVEAEAKAEEIAGAETEAVTEETAGAEAEIESFNTDEPYEYETDKEGKTTYKTTVTYEKDSTNKKATIGDIVTITNVTDPVSWNGSYAPELIRTVLFGDDATDSWLNNSSSVTVSRDAAKPRHDIKGIMWDVQRGYTNYDSIAVKEGEAYILVAYGLDSGETAYVDGLDESVTTYGEYTEPYAIPVIEWDGRKIDFNKSGDNKYTTSKKEALNVAAALVTYSNGTVKEVPGFSISVKVDSKNQKASSVAAATTMEAIKYKTNVTDETTGKTSIGEDDWYVDEHAALSTLPSFTISAKVKGNDGKAYKKDLKNVLKSQAYYFGIEQCKVSISNFEDYNYFFYINRNTTHDDSGKPITVISSGDAKIIEKEIAEQLVNNGSYDDKDTDEYLFDYPSFKISKFNGKKANLVQYGDVGQSGNYSQSAVNKLKPKKDYNFTDGSLAGETVQVLEFVDGGNYVYDPAGWIEYTDKTGKKAYAESYSNLAQLGFKYAFRVSPTNKKMFRHGIFKESNIGFVYDVED